VLGCCRDRPACSPIGLHGVCGRGVREAAPIVVGDVAELGAAYVACDPLDRSELVLPLLDEGGVWGVLDLDSRLLDAFGPRDVEGLVDLVDRAGLLRPTPPQTPSGSGPV